MRDKELQACPVASSLTVLGNPWKFLIIRDLSKGPRRFGELKTSVTRISPKSLTNNLYELVEDGIITRTQYSEIPPRTEYELTELGLGLLPIIFNLAKWGDEYKQRKLLEKPNENTVIANEDNLTK